MQKCWIPYRAGADIDATDKIWCTPLHMHQFMEFSECRHLLYYETSIDKKKRVWRIHSAPGFLYGGNDDMPIFWFRKAPIWRLKTWGIYTFFDASLNGWIHLLSDLVEKVWHICNKFRIIMPDTYNNCWSARRNKISAHNRYKWQTKGK